QLSRGLDYRRPVADVAIRGEIIRAVDCGIAGAQNLFFRQPDETIAARVRPAEEVETHLARTILHDEWALIEGLLGRLRGAELQFGYVGAAFGGGLPARGFVALHFLSHALVSERGGAGLRPYRIAVGVVAVVVRVEDVLYGLAGDTPDSLEREARAAREI